MFLKLKRNTLIIQTRQSTSVLPAAVQLMELSRLGPGWCHWLLLLFVPFIILVLVQCEWTRRCAGGVPPGWGVPRLRCAGVSPAEVWREVPQLRSTGCPPGWGAQEGSLPLSQGPPSWGVQVRPPPCGQNYKQTPSITFPHSPCAGDNNCSQTIFPAFQTFSLCFSKILCFPCLENVRFKSPFSPGPGHPVTRWNVNKNAN